MSRLTPAELFDITKRKRPRMQAAWFRDHLNVDVPFDREGPIITEATFEALVAKRCGILPSSAENHGRPVVKLRQATASDHKKAA